MRACCEACVVWLEEDLYLVVLGDNYRPPVLMVSADVHVFIEKLSVPLLLAGTRPALAAVLAISSVVSCRAGEILPLICLSPIPLSKKNNFSFYITVSITTLVKPSSNNLPELQHPATFHCPNWCTRVQDLEHTYLPSG